MVYVYVSRVQTNGALESSQATVSSFTYRDLISPGPKSSQRMFLATRSHDDSLSKEYRVTSTTIVVFGRQGLSENMHDVCLIASLFSVLVFVSNLLDNFLGNWLPFYRFSTTLKVFRVLIAPNPSPAGLFSYRHLLS